MSAVSTQSAAFASRPRGYFFFAAACVMLVVVVFGFSKTFYFRPWVSEGQRLPATAYLCLHGAVMSAWYVFFVMQTFLVASNRTALHRRMGIVGAGLAVAVVLTGAYVSLRLPGRVAALGAPPDVQISAGLILTIGGLVRLVVFSSLIAAALALRRRSAWHGRLMFWSFLLTLDPAFGGNGTRPLGPFVESYLGVGPLAQHFLIPVVGFVSLAAHDWLSAKRIRPATWIGGLIYMVYGGPLPFMIAGTEAARTFIQSLV